MIAFEHVTKDYHVKGVHKRILEDASYQFAEGKNIALMGHNGVGKSTMMRMIAGIEPPTSGAVKCTEKVSWPMGFSKGFNGLMTGVENVRFVARVYGCDTEQVLAQVQEFAELGPSLDLPIETYSSGMKARLAFGLSLAIRFECYLVDEITAVGDQRFRKKSEHALRERIEASRVVMISHSERTIREFCDEGVLAYGGKLYHYDDLNALIADYKRFC
ncbi:MULTISPECIES: ABC transporter ATP-binding protein [unclassified Shimia]|uniref:ABC transporter ATP-binding protein n=1 Tax=unclassified Shimia TaxID=2630038 RepID=UPI001AD9FDD4|nr:ABC transporter ATP-binding protein [Shimia sp. R9_2]MBO9403011.1 ABC transporter ATP-binding protein [Shimia sp. R9_3]